MAGSLDESRRRAASRIRGIARQFAVRSRDDQMRLVHEFEQAIRDDAAALGTVSIEDGDDEQLALGADGRFQGRLLEENDGRSAWQVVGGAGDIVDHYDLVDLFADLTDAIDEVFPGLEDAPGDVQAVRPDPLDSPLTGNERAAHLAIGPWAERAAASPPDSVPSSPPDPGEEAESPSRRILRDLHAAGVYSDAEYAAKLAELDQAGT
jgi:hypothetical protein